LTAMKTDSKQWYVIRTKPCREFVAQTHFEQQGFTTYLPHTITTRKHARKISKVPQPLFPGYLFLHLSPEEQHWTTISSTRGATGPVRFGTTIPSLPDWVITTLKNMEEQHGRINLKAVKEKFLQPGSTVKVSLDRQRELHGILLSFTGKDRAVVLLNMLQRTVKTTVPLTRLHSA